MKECVDIADWSPDKVYPRLSTTPPSDLLETTSVSHESPGPPLPLLSLMPSPASRGCKLQQLENYETNHDRLPTQSPWKPSSPWESSSPRKLSAQSKLSLSDGNRVSTPTSHTKSVSLVLNTLLLLLLLLCIIIIIISINMVLLCKVYSNTLCCQREVRSVKKCL